MHVLGTPPAFVLSQDQTLIQKFELALVSLLTYYFLTGYFRNPHVWFVFLFSSQRSLRIKILIGKTGFEPATPWSQTKYSTKLSYFPMIQKKIKKIRQVF